jgi:3-deoxy-D-manno-octulosonic-acid transferase
VLIAKDGSRPSQEDESLIHARIKNEELSTKLASFPKNSIFLIDPIGNFMLYYNPTDINVKFVLKDLKRLLKYSRIG